jgi:isoquinoline 1-oxidoreductase
MMETGIRRRDLFGLAGAGLFVYFHAEAQEPARLPGRQSGPADLNAYLKIGADGRVTCLVGKVELAVALAEELDVPFDSVDVVMGDTDLCPYDMGTFGSMCTPLLWPAVRRAGAEAKAVLVQMAAERFDVPARSARADEGPRARRRLCRQPRRASHDPGGLQPGCSQPAGSEPLAPGAASDPQLLLH